MTGVWSKCGCGWCLVGPFLEDICPKDRLILGWEVVGCWLWVGNLLAIFRKWGKLDFIFYLFLTGNQGKQGLRNIIYCSFLKHGTGEVVNYLCQNIS